MLRGLHHPLLLGLSFAAALCAAGCATSDPLMPPDPGSGGAQLSTGAAGSTGATGTTGAAGTTGVGGKTGVGGTSGAAGTSGTGGPTTGGASGAVGGPGLGGSTGTAGTKGGAGIAGIAGIAGTIGTGGDGAGGQAGSGTAVYRCTGSTATFTQVYNDILVKYCAGGGCHNPGKSGGVSFRTQSSAYAVFSALSMPGDVTGSDIYSTIASYPPFMPPRIQPFRPAASPSWPPGSAPARPTTEAP